MVFVLWLEVFTSHFLPGLVWSSFMVWLALLGGVTVQVSYTCLQGTHSFVDECLGRFGKWFGFPVLFFGLFIIGLRLGAISISQLGWQDFFARGGSGAMLLLGVSLAVMESSICYQNKRNQTEREKEIC